MGLLEAPPFQTFLQLIQSSMADMTITMVPFNAIATGTVPIRLGGTTASQTEVAIAYQTGRTGTAINCLTWNNRHSTH